MAFYVDKVVVGIYRFKLSEIEKLKIEISKLLLKTYMCI